MGSEAKTVHLVLSLDRGGLERMVVDLAGSMRRREFVVACLDARGALAGDVERAGGRVEVVARKPGFDPGLVWRLSRFLKAEQPTVLHTHGLDPLFYGALAATLAGSMVRVHTQHNVQFDGYRRRDRLKFRIASRLFQRMIAVSRTTEVALAARGVRPEKLRTILNGVDLKRFDSPVGAAGREGDGVSVVGTVARLAHEKGVDVLIDAAERAKRHGRTLQVRIAGDGPQRAELEDRVRRAGLEDDVRFCGFRDDVTAFLDGLDLFVLPSRTEGMPLALLEAMAMRKAIVATDVGGVGQVVADGESGLLVPPSDAGALADAITGLLEDPARRAQLGAEARRVVERDYDLQGTARAYEALYETTPRETVIAGLIKTGILSRFPRRLMTWRGRGDRGQVALTFDDGPDTDYTPRILDRLAEAGMRATFFLIGERVADRTDLFRRILDEGHEIGNHSYSHPAVEQLSFREVQREIVTTQALFARHGWQPLQWRPPRGKLTAGTVLGAWLRGLTVALWSVDFKDFRAGTAEEIRARIDVNALGSGDVVLYHGNCDAAYAALPALLEAVRRSGLQAVTVSELSRR